MASVSDGSRELWLPEALLREMRRLSAPGEDLQDFVLVALEQELRRRRGERTYARLLQLRAQAQRAARRRPRA